MFTCISQEVSVIKLLFLVLLKLELFFFLRTAETKHATLVPV